MTPINAVKKEAPKAGVSFLLCSHLLAKARAVMSERFHPEE